ncbi:acyl-CoA dehydrogenase family protein [Notoacmeibacter ruber]|uniref:Acyl-CoA dehydrogenase n=1 Tax=Notoacmeibacter ruber TaxID=2670375 RepID=A0A3L7JKS6_9HYPH|nr:acyl-CoA dehydrogenase family protein [Notoacmeibacter ruber]RLQ89122.1 acyl-CoA dehydrogenase [Notoacmeibacter ruber]
MNKHVNADISDLWPGDFYRLWDTLPEEDRSLLKRLRAFMETEVAPIVDQHWRDATFPHDIIPKLGELDLIGTAWSGEGFRDQSYLLDGLIAVELTRIDPSIGTFVGVQGPLAAASIYHCGSDEQKAEWLPKMRNFELIGSFGLTEPQVGSAISEGMLTTARREGDQWVLNGQKKWIGNASFADLNVIWARDESDNQVKAFVVEKGTPGFETEVIADKIALRIVQNAIITLKDCRVSEANRLPGARSFEDTAKVLRLSRGSVAWQAAGCALGAFETALAYTRKREQFGEPVASFQLIQEHLVEMLGAVTASLLMCKRLSELQDAGEDSEEQASLAKAFCTAQMRQAVARGREALGGNGILLEHKVARFFADAEAIYSYEGSREVQTLIVGRAITGESAFV